MLYAKYTMSVFSETVLPNHSMRPVPGAICGRLGFHRLTDQTTKAVKTGGITVVIRQLIDVVGGDKEEPSLLLEHEARKK
jgi:hypothetical protein